MPDKSLVLVVDINEQRRSLVCRVLESQPYEIIQADASNCLDVCERQHPELIILICSLSDGIGFSLCHQIRTSLENQPVILAILETVTQESIDRVLQSGADDYITSPIHAALLERRLRLLSDKRPTGKTQEIAVALRDSERRYKTLFDIAPISIFSKDRDGRYTSANAYNLTYHRPGGPIGHTDFELFAPDVAEMLRAADLHVMETGQELEIEETVPTSQGIRIALSRKVPLRNSAGEIDGILGISEDITQRKKVEQALQESNERFAALFEHSPDAVFLLEAQAPSIIVDCNAAACRMNGYSREELIGQPIALLDVEENTLPLDEEIDYADWLRTKGQVKYEVLHRRKDGTTFPIEVSTCLVTIAGRELILGIDRDISERYEMERAERKQRILAEALRDTAFALSSTLDLNEVLDRILTHAANIVPHETSSIGLIQENGFVHIVRCRGFAERGLEDLALSMRFPLAGHSHYTAMVANQQPIVVDDVLTFSGWFVHPAMAWIRAHVTTPIIVRDKVIGFLHLDSVHPGAFTAEHARNLQILASQVAIAIQNAQYTDELEQRVREATAELRCALIRERELNELKTRFLTMASHEFRTPLSIIMTSSELLKNYYERMNPDQRLERFDHIQTEINNMTTLLEEILKVNRTVGSSPQKVTPELLNVPFFCQAVISKITYDKRRVFEFVCDEHCTVAMLDANLLSDILTSLLSNAVKYSRVDQPVRLEVTCDDDQIMFTVQDYGIGIPEEDRDHVFEVFHRGRNINHISGTGLGLTIAKQSTELHGGTLTFTSTIGVGTTFTLSIPKEFLKERV